MTDYFTHFLCLLDVGTPTNAACAIDLCNALCVNGASEVPPSDGCLLSIQPEHGGSAHVLDLATGETLASTYTDSRLASVLGGGDGDA